MLRDGTIFSREWGEPDGRILLCWHGAGGSADDFAEIAPALAERLRLRVVAIDAPGHARSPSPAAEAFRPTALARLATEILDELDVGRAIFVGFSWGATVGVWLAATFPERVLGLALVEGGHMDFADVPGFRADRTLDEWVSDAAAAAASQGSAFGSHTPAVAGAMIHGLSQEPATSAYPRLAAWAIPTLFVGARQESPFPPLERLARLVPQLEIVQLASSSHDLLLDGPADVARVVGDWLATLPS